MKSHELNTFVEKSRLFLLFFVSLLCSSTVAAQDWLDLTAGAINYVNIGDLDVPGNTITVEAKITMTGPSVNIVSKHIGPPDVNYLLRPGGFEMTTTNGYVNVVNSYPMQNNVCYHVAATYDGSSLKYYVNGCLTGEVQASGNLMQNNFGTAIGNREDCECEQFTGYIDEVRIWNVARTQAQIQANMNSLPTPPLQTGLQAYYNFEGNLINIQGNTTYNGTAVGNPQFNTNPNCSGPIEAIDLTATGTDVVCFGDANGTIDANGSGGITPYEYSVDGTNYQASNNFSGLAPGTYNVTVRYDANCVSQSESITIGEPPEIEITLDSINDVSCNGGSDGAIYVSVTNGVAPLNYSWSGGQSSQDATNLSQGNYTLTITDDDGCTVDSTFTVSEPTVFTASITSSADASCNGGTDGTATVTANGGTSPYTYQWDNGQTQDQAVGLGAGNYSVTVTDANGCTATDNVTISEPPPLAANITSSTDVSCFGGSDGSATAAANGGTPPYLFSWSNGQASATADNLIANTYTVTVTDANGCIQTADVTIDQPDEISITIQTITNVSCYGGSDGSATMNVSGGTAPYAYNWSNGQNGPNISNLVAGTYILDLTDNNGCTAQTSVDITEPDTLVASIEAFTNVSCDGGNDGSVTVEATGGVQPYSYQWSNGQTDSVATGLSAGDYTCTITDDNGCSVSIDHTVNEPQALNVSIVSSNDVSCFGGTDGHATAAATGGTPPYTYAWSSGGNGNSDNNMVAGNNSVSVTDVNGCTASVNFNLNEPPLLSSQASGSTLICIGENTTLSATASGGVPPYDFHWNNGFIGSPLVVGPNTDTDYWVYAEDDNGCTTIVDTVTVEVRPSLDANTIPGSFVICEGESVTFSASANGGDGAYTFTWDNGLPAGVGPHTVAPDTTTVYTVTVTDNCGSPPSLETVTVNVNPLPDVAFTVDDSSGCRPHGVQFENESTIPEGDIADFFWDFGDGESTDFPFPFHIYDSAGTYSVTLTAISEAGCVDSLTHSNIITAFPKPTAAFDYKPDEVLIVDPEVQFTDQSEGAVFYTWSFGDGDSTDVPNPEHVYTDTGTYFVNLYVENTFGCSSEAFRRVIVNPLPTVYVPSAFTPDDSGLNDNFVPKGSEFTEFEMEIYNRWGVQVFETNDDVNGWDGTNERTGNPALPGVYIYKIFFRDTRGKQNRLEGYVHLIR